ncbi:enoyl-CoA hydratase/isomerase family protein [Pacificibacter marinus]|uniref:enoyl-CoA hydratase/isomerase family protein n=1 Tax=Pacificibacter marinus TaxID=658057 RepID=UPI001C07969E|nr:enoyl-CoA hydratase/isomerase family protein [Pacificibacter marinus]MBU2867422.1 enoyl-CoA hydratase/isomerase family protein [Pacificibacter marinus]
MVNSTPSAADLPQVHQLAGKILIETESAVLRDAGDGVGLLYFSTKLNTINHGVLDMLERVPDFPEVGLSSLVIASNNPKVFSAGAQIKTFIKYLEEKNYSAFDAFVRRGQRAMTGLATAPIPVVSALGRLALGGGAEILLNSDLVVAAEPRVGFPERTVGIIPGWSGTTHLMARACAHNLSPEQAATQVARTIVTSQPTEKFHEMVVEGILLSRDLEVSEPMLLPTAIREAIRLSEDYVPQSFSLLSVPGREHIAGIIDTVMSDTTPENEDHVLPIVTELANCLSATTGNSLISFNEMLAKEAYAVARLARRPETLQLMRQIVG